MTRDRIAATPWASAQRVIELGGGSLIDRLATTDDPAEMRAIIDQVKQLLRDAEEPQ